MKKVITMILALGLVLSMAACDAKEPEETTAPTKPAVTETQETAPEETAPVDTTAPTEPEQAPAASISAGLSGWELDEGLAYGGFAVSTGNAATDAAVQSSLEKKLAEIRQEPGSVIRVVNPARMDEKIVSLFGKTAQGVDEKDLASFYLDSMTFDVESGKQLTMWDVFRGDEEIAQLKEMVIARLDETEGEIRGPGFEREEFLKTMELHFDRNDSRSDGWYLSGDGFMCYFTKYEMNVPIGGQVLIPYEKLTNLMKPEYLPGEAPQATGSVTADLAGEGAADYVVAQNPDGAQIDLTVAGTVTNFRLDAVAGYDIGQAYVPYSILFAANQLSDGAVIRVQTDIPDTMPNLRLTYFGAEGKVVRYITMSGMDGSILLVEQ